MGLQGEQRGCMGCLEAREEVAWVCRQRAEGLKLEKKGEWHKVYQWTNGPLVDQTEASDVAFWTRMSPKASAEYAMCIGGKDDYLHLFFEFPYAWASPNTTRVDVTSAED